MAAKTGMVLVPVALLAVHDSASALAAERTYEKRDQKIFELLDENEDGRISVAEFKNNQMLIFYIMDRNKDLVLTRDETALPAEVFDRLAGAGGKINTMEFLNAVDEAFKQADTNHDMSIDREEFRALMRRVRD